MIDNQTQSVDFGYYFSAFLPACRSVTLVMQKEFKKFAGFESWYENKRNIMKSDGKMRLLLNLRNVTLKAWPAKLNKQETLTVHVTAGVISVQATVITPQVRTDGELLPSNHNDKQHGSSNLKKQKEPADTSDIETTIRWTIDEKSFDDDSKQDIKKIPNKDEILKTDVITICKECMNMLSDIVLECERMFVIT